MDINVSVDAIVGLVRHQFAIMNVRIEEDYAPGLPLVMADDKQIQEVVVNLLNNAREAMAGRGWVLVRTALDGDFVRIDVQDNGSGMTTETINKIWEPFFTTKDKGTGLGLPVCFGIIKAHKGELLCTSVPGQGTTMSILLPIPRKV
jgi:signal transduction histidine kinase